MFPQQLGVTAETMAMAKTALSADNKMYMDQAGNLHKSVTTATGLVTYDLQAPAKNLYPVITPIRNAIGRVHRTGGTATNWKAIQALVGSGYDAMGWVPEGQRSGAMNYVAVDVAAPYRTLGEEDNLTFEASSAAEGFEDENAMVTMRLLQKMMLKEESALLGGNRTVSLGTAATPTVTNNTTAGSIPAATYGVKVVALTIEGWQNSSVTGGVAGTKTVTGMDGKTFTLNGGSGAPSTGASTTLGAPGQIFASTPVVNGAVAYAWYVGPAGSERLQAISTINSVNIQTYSNSTQLVTAVAGDNSANANLAFDGLLTTAFSNYASSGNAYVQYLPTGTAGTGTVLTASGRGTVVEIDNMLRSMWDKFRISATVIYVNAQELQNITNKCLSNASGPLLRYDIDPSQSYSLTAGGVISAYFNPFGMNGGTKIPVKLHPTLPPGTILAYAEQLPTWYQSNETPQVAQVITRRDYYRIDWPLVTRQYQYGVYAEETLAVYAPFAMGVITNIANG